MIVTNTQIELTFTIREAASLLRLLRIINRLHLSINKRASTFLVSTGVAEDWLRLEVDLTDLLYFPFDSKPMPWTSHVLEQIKVVASEQKALAEQTGEPN